MKFAIVFIAVVSLAYAVPLHTRSSQLQDDLDNYMALIPKPQLVALFYQYQSDPDVQKIVAYLRSDDFAKVAHIITGNDQIQDLVNYIDGEGVAIKDLINRLADRLGLPHWPAYRSYGKASRTLNDFVQEAIALLPVNDIIALTLDKLANSEAFQNLYIKISSIDGQKLHDDALSHPEIVDLIERLNNLGVDTKKAWDILQTIFGWGHSTRSYAASGLKQDFYDYVALVPIDEFKALFKKYENDAEVQALITRVRTYLHSKDFAKVVHIISQNDQIQDLVSYIEGEGLRIIEAINLLADRLALPHWPTSFRAVRHTRSVESFVEEFIALIPINDILALTLDKLANSESFQNLYLKISSVEGQKVHDDALSHPEIVDLVARLNNLGVDTKKIWDMLQVVFGWSKYQSRSVAGSTYTLNQDFYDYVALIPIDDLKALFKKYENDAEVQALITRVRTYLHSEDFAKVAHIIAQNDQLQDLVSYIEGEGLRIIEVINLLADRLALPHWPASFRAVSHTRSVESFVDEFNALIPINDILALTLDKLANSESFQNFYLKISSLDGHKLYDDALAHPEIVDLIDLLNNLGVDTKKIWETLQLIFGW